MVADCVLCRAVPIIVIPLVPSEQQITDVVAAVEASVTGSVSAQDGSIKEAISSTASLTGSVSRLCSRMIVYT